MTETDSNLNKKRGEQGAERAPSDKKRILIADDERQIRDVFRQIVSYELSDCWIDVAINGAEAVESFRTIHQAVILMDLRMPVMDGETAYNEIIKICEEQNWEKPSVIFCTGFGPTTTLENILANNPAHCMLHKPVSDKTLMEAIRSRLAK